MKKTSIKFIIRLLISIILLGLLIAKIEFRDIGNVLKGFNPLPYIYAVCLLYFHQYVWASMWRFALRGKGIDVSYKTIYKAILMGHFFGIFLPSSLGPDIVLTFNIGKTLKEKQHAFSSLLFIRIMNMTGLLFVSGIILIFISCTFLLKQILLITWLLLLMIWLSCWLIMHSRSRTIIGKILNRYKLLNPFYKIFYSFSTFGLDNKVTLKLWFLGMVMTFLKSLFDYLIALSLGIKISYIWFLGLIPSISTISLLPISIAGLGIREGAYVGIFSNIGIPPAQSMSISLTVFTLNIWLCITGGIIYLIYGSYRNPVRKSGTF